MTGNKTIEEAVAECLADFGTGESHDNLWVYPSKISNRNFEPYRLQVKPEGYDVDLAYFYTEDERRQLCPVWAEAEPVAVDFAGSTPRPTFGPARLIYGMPRDRGF